MLNQDRDPIIKDLSIILSKTYQLIQETKRAKINYKDDPEISRVLTNNIKLLLESYTSMIRLKDKFLFKEFREFINDKNRGRKI